MSEIDHKNHGMLVAVHVCRECGVATERSKVNDDSVFTGLVRCPSCGHEGNLNLEIHGNQQLQKKPPSKAATRKGDR